jgi:transposase
MHRYALRNDQWAKITDVLPGCEGHVGGDTDDRLFVDAVIYRYRKGIPWRDLPDRYGPWKSTHRRYRRLCECGVFAGIFDMLVRDADNEFMMLDGRSCAPTSTVPAPKKAGQNQAIGRSRGGLTTKIHAVVDAQAREILKVMSKPLSAMGEGWVRSRSYRHRAR